MSERERRERIHHRMENQDEKEERKAKPICVSKDEVIFIKKIQYY